jgi:hypothetical protein
VKIFECGELLIIQVLVIADYDISRTGADVSTDFDDDLQVKKVGFVNFLQKHTQAAMVRLIYYRSI